MALLAACTPHGGAAARASLEDPPTTRNPPKAYLLAASRAHVALDTSSADSPLSREIDAAGLRAPVQACLTETGRACATPPLAIQCEPMLAAARSPLNLAEAAQSVCLPALATLPRDDGEPTSSPRALAEIVTRAFGGNCADLPASQGSVPVPSVQGAVYAMDFLLNAPRVLLEPVVANRPSPEETRSFLMEIGREVNPGAATEERQALVARLARDMHGGPAGAMRHFALALAHIDASLGCTLDWSAAEADPVPPEIQGAIDGAVLSAQLVDGIGWIVIGGLGDNSYDMSAIAGVMDAGGNDTYRWSRPRTGNQGVVDLAGNDRYIGGDGCGPATGVLGLSFVQDFAGNDSYEGGDFGCAVGVLGVGVIFDYAGHDRYRAGSWSLGAGAFGVGAIVDADGSDTYEAASYAQGLGGPLGIGVLLDQAGADLYRVDGAIPSIYGLPAVFLAMSQGVGFGARNLCAGGVGLLVDGAGDDRYEAGEFAQGGAYYHAFGALLDVCGDDLYRGDRYTQGFGVHRGAGTLIDLDGRDTYWGTMAANQGAAWDEATGLLLDAAGDDSYRGGLLSQGAAAHQSVAALVDLAGSDHYIARGPSAQGVSGDNSYHFKACNTRSVSVFAFAGDGVDTPPELRRHVGATGPWREATPPPTAPLYGFVIEAALERPAQQRR